MVVRQNQLLLSRIDARNGAIGLVPEELDGAVVTNDFPAFALDPDRLEPFYINWLSKTADFVELCKAASEGTTNRVRLKEERFLALEIPLPPLPEQRRIVARIEALAAKIEEARGLRRQAVEEREAFITSVHNQLAGNRKRVLGDILRLSEDQVPILPTESYPQVGVKSFGCGLFAKSAIRGSETTYRHFNRLYDGAIVLSQVKGWEGAVAVCGADLVGWFVSPEYRTFRCKSEEVRPDYLSVLACTEWFWGRLAAATRGVGARRERTRPEHFLAIELPMPPVEKQILGEALFQRMTSVKPLQAAAAAEFDALLPSVLDKAFKGEL
jgi:type I restriction enzyme S subunit